MWAPPAPPGLIEGGYDPRRTEGREMANEMVILFNKHRNFQSRRATDQPVVADPTDVVVAATAAVGR